MKILILLLTTALSFSQGITYDIYQDGVLKASTTNLNYTATGLSPSTTYSFYIVAKDVAGNQSPISNIITIKTLPLPIQNTYCTSKGATSKERINSVTLGTINNYSGNNDGYGDYTSIKFDVSLNSINNFTITPFWVSTIFNEAYRIWIDFNQDGDFFDSGELVFSQSKTKKTSIVGKITIPSNSKIGMTRMRISMKNSAFSNPCEIFTNGEVEDYTINVK